MTVTDLRGAAIVVSLRHDLQGRPARGRRVVFPFAEVELRVFRSLAEDLLGDFGLIHSAREHGARQVDRDVNLVRVPFCCACDRSASHTVTHENNLMDFERGQ